MAEPDQTDLLLRQMFEAAVRRVAAEHCLPPHLPKPPGPGGKTVVIGAGKASASMAAVLELIWPGELSGLVVTRHGHGAATEQISVIEAAHPVPDEAGQRAAKEILGLVSGLGADDLLICLISGGGSALLSLPAPGLSLADKQALTQALLASGAEIAEINCLRKHLSAIKGGRLALAAHPARVASLAISDVPGDDPAVIASGPTEPDPTSFADARAVLAKYAIEAPSAIQRHLREAKDETPKPGDPRLAGVATTIIARPGDGLEAAADFARRAGIEALILGEAIEGEAREVAAEMAGRALALARDRSKPCVLLSGGETTVTLRGKGRGGPNSEFALALALALQGAPRIHAIACDTDGIDGTEDNAGAMIAPGTLRRARAAGLDAESYLADNDSHGFFSRLGDLVRTGPTLTNIGDFRAIVVG